MDRLEMPLPKGWKLYLSLGTDCFQLGVLLMISPRREKIIDLSIYAGFFYLSVGASKW